VRSLTFAVLFFTVVFADTKVDDLSERQSEALDKVGAALFLAAVGCAILGL
jgi:hypothetical protein